MLMRMLDAGGLEPLTDHLRTADVDNPHGYYEFERVKQIATDQGWLDDAEGRVVKMVSALLTHLPADRQYRVVFLRRRMEEVLASQKKMLARLGKPTDGVSDAEMARLLGRHLQQIEAWLAAQPNIRVLYVNYHDVVADPRGEAKRINAFLGGTLDAERMAAAVDPNLYRNRVAAASGG
jgi:hypothetical protein